MKKILIAVCVCFLSAVSFAQSVNWDAKIIKIRTHSNGDVKLFLSNLDNSSPTSTFNCGDNNIVTIISDDIDAKKIMLTTAIMAYNDGMTVRIGIDNCGATYIALPEK